MKNFNKNPQCEVYFQTENNESGGLFSMVDVYIYPTIKEVVGLTITKAMCMGMPIVTTDYPTMNEWIDDNIEGGLIKPKKVKNGSMPIDKVIIDLSHLAEIMIDYIDNPQKVTEHSYYARQRIEQNFNWDDHDEQILKLIKA